MQALPTPGLTRIGRTLIAVIAILSSIGTATSGGVTTVHCAGIAVITRFRSGATVAIRSITGVDGT